MASSSSTSSSTPHLSFFRPQSHTHQNRKNPIPNLPSLALFLISLSISDHPWCCLVNNSRTFHKIVEESNPLKQTTRPWSSAHSCPPNS